jgi:hypothetical protein
MPADTMLVLQSLGYTEREASFLYIVAAHSGYFLRRQFDYFIDRQRGAIAQHFLEKSRRLRHVEIIDYGESRYAYHLFAKPIYRLVGNSDSQNRRWKGDGVIRARLIALDYVLANENDHFLITEAERIHFFASERRIPRELFTDRDGRLLAMLASLPISIANRTQPSSSPVRFLFADEALLTIKRFCRFLSESSRLLRALDNFEIIYASNSEHLFPLAKEEFWKRFETNHGAVQSSLDEDWRRNSREFAIRQAPVHARFTTLFLKYNYPPIRRKELPSPRGVRQSGLAGKAEAKQKQTHEPVVGPDMG